MLPVYGKFTGMHTLPQGPLDRDCVSTGDAVRKVPNLHSHA